MPPIECINIKDHYHNAYKDSLNRGKGKDSTYTNRKHDLWSSKLVAKNLITRTVLLQWQIFRFPNPCFLIVTNYHQTMKSSYTLKTTRQHFCHYVRICKNKDCIISKFHETNVRRKKYTWLVVERIILRKIRIWLNRVILRKIHIWLKKWIQFLA